MSFLWTEKEALGHMWSLCQPSDVWQNWSVVVVHAENALQMLCGMETGLEGCPACSNRLAMVRHMHRLSGQLSSEDERCGVQLDPYSVGRGAPWMVHRTRKHDSGLVWCRVSSQQLDRGPHEIWKLPLGVIYVPNNVRNIGLMGNSVRRE